MFPSLVGGILQEKRDTIEATEEEEQVYLLNEETEEVLEEKKKKKVGESPLAVSVNYKPPALMFTFCVVTYLVDLGNIHKAGRRTGKKLGKGAGFARDSVDSTGERGRSKGEGS